MAGKKTVAKKSKKVIEKKIDEITKAEEPNVEEKEKEKIKEDLRVDVLKEKSSAPAHEKLEPLQPGQKYFEAPDGTIVIGEADKQQVWHRKLNNGRGGWINPKR